MSTTVLVCGEMFDGVSEGLTKRPDILIKQSECEHRAIGIRRHHRLTNSSHSRR